VLSPAIAAALLRGVFLTRKCSRHVEFAAAKAAFTTASAHRTG
jgi:hypothetical protein